MKKNKKKKLPRKTGVSRRTFCKSLGAVMPLAIAVSPDVIHNLIAENKDPYLYRLFAKFEVASLEAMAEQIIPTDEFPGAREANVVRYIDYVLGTDLSDFQHGYFRDSILSKNYSDYVFIYKQGIKKLNASSRFLYDKPFVELTFEEQTTVLIKMDEDQIGSGIWKEFPASDFFKVVREHVFEGYYGDPKYGGNRDEVGWKMIGFHYGQPYTPEEIGPALKGLK